MSKSSYHDGLGVLFLFVIYRDGQRKTGREKNRNEKERNVHYNTLKCGWRSKNPHLYIYASACFLPYSILFYSIL